MHIFIYHSGFTSFSIFHGFIAAPLRQRSYIYKYSFNAAMTASYSASDSVFLFGSMANVPPHSNSSS